ncbi:MAG: HAD family phosphatase [Spirochaetia bacterium]|jgi:phosphoglycolate phosphatase/pyrophosphatase PpaX|nr:HAD family phosphatase [Spirochaetia bacterium]
MNLRYKCLFLDHDDTSVDSTPVIHHKAHIEVMKIMRPHLDPLSLDDWFRINFDPGIMAYMTDDLGMDSDEIASEYEIWRKYTSGIVPDFFPGIIDILLEYRKRGGKIVVVSHSEKDLIERDYTIKGFSGSTGFFPDMIFGWSYDESKRKPYPWPVLTALDALGISAKESLILDDLKPGVLLGQNTGVETAAAGWSYDIPEIKEYMIENCVRYFTTVKEFGDFILEE